MRITIAIVSLIMMICATIPQIVSAQARTTALVTATVIPSVSIELTKQNTVDTKGSVSSVTMNLRGNEHILVVVDSKEVKSVKILQLTDEKPAKIDLPSSQQIRKTSITYLSS
jgi:hypothetical protein